MILCSLNSDEMSLRKQSLLLVQISELIQLNSRHFLLLLYTFMARVNRFVLIIYVQIKEEAPIILTILGVVFLFFGLANIMSTIKGEKPSKDWVVNEHDEEL